MPDAGNSPVPAITGQPGWIYDRPPPGGGKVLLLTEGKVAVIGTWAKDGGYIAWSPLPKRDKAIETRLGFTPPVPSPAA